MPIITVPKHCIYCILIGQVSFDGTIAGANCFNLQQKHVHFICIRNDVGEDGEFYIQQEKASAHHHENLSKK